MGSRYTQKPIDVEAMQWSGANWADLKAWFQAQKTSGTCELRPLADGTGRLLLIGQLIEGELVPSDWVVVNGNGIVFFCNDETFQSRFDLSDDEVLDPEGGSIENPLGA